MKPPRLASLSCSFTGHRPEKLPWGDNEKDPACIRLKEKLYDAVEAVHLGGIRHFICGMARGADMYFCEAVIRLRDEDPEVTLEAAIPCEGQYRGWPAADRERYDYLIAQCDEVTLLQTEYTKDCMINRNRYMVDSSSVLIAVGTGAPGGTKATADYAKKTGREVIWIWAD